MNLTQHIGMLKAGGPGSGRHPMGMHLAVPIHVDGGGWKKIGQQKGTNPGGTYINPSTNKSYYVKFSQTNPEQLNAEHLADHIYSALGIPSKESMLVTDGTGTLGLASPLVEGAKNMSADEIAKHPDVKNGFIADALLANWDFAGLVNDNIVKDSAGHAHRIDNGGTFGFKAQGGEKPYGTAVPELNSLKQNQGKQAFTDLTRKDERQQVMRMAKVLNDGKIKNLVASAGITGDKADHYTKMLQQRRDFLQGFYNVPK